MAILVDQFTSKKGRPPEHPWDEWADGQARLLVRSRNVDGRDIEGDFTAQLVSMRTMIHRKAREMGKRAFTHINLADQSIRVQFYDPKE